MKDILAIDVGTTSLKMAVFTPELEKKCEVSQSYEINLYDRGRASFISEEEEYNESKKLN